jgi:hypothetical protein
LVGSAAPTATVAADSGPTISKVGVSEAKGTISWNVYDAAGVKGTSLKIDGKIVTDVSGPYKAASGVNYIAKFGVLSAGSHTYTIRASDKSGVVSTLTGTFTLAGPTISDVIVTPSKGMISWNVYDAAGVKATSLKVDGKIVTHVSGPFGAASGVNYAAKFGTLSAGSHTYTIRATDSSGVVSTLTGTFTVGS